MEKLIESIRLNLQNDIEAVRNGYHIYMSGKGKCVILDFNEKGTLMNEEEFDDMDEAMHQFLEKSKKVIRGENK